TAWNKLVARKARRRGHAVATHERLTLATEKARLAGNAGVQRDGVAHPHMSYGGAHFANNAAHFVTEHFGRLVQGDTAVEHAQVGRADAAADHFDQDVVGAKRRQRTVFEPHVVGAVPDP